MRSVSRVKWKGRRGGGRRTKRDGQAIGESSTQESILRREEVRDTTRVEETTAVAFLYFLATAIIERACGISKLKIKIKMQCRATKTIMADVNKAWRFPRGRWSGKKQEEGKGRKRKRGRHVCIYAIIEKEKDRKVKCKTSPRSAYLANEAWPSDQWLFFSFFLEYRHLRICACIGCFLSYCADEFLI